MANVIDILEGHLNELFKTNEELFEHRLNICKKCPIYKESPSWGPMCDNTKWINENEEVSYVYKQGFIKGCGCRLKAKTRLIDNHCIINKW